MNIRRILLGFVAVMLAAGLQSVQAVDGTWTNNADGDWSDIGNWDGGTVADGADFTATFGDFITANRSVNLDSDRTIGNITAADTGSNYSITNRILTLDVASGSPAIDVPNGRILTVRSEIAGSDGFTKTGLGQLRIFGNNTFTGGLVIDAGSLGANKNAITTEAVNNNHITVTGDARITFNSGFTTTSGVTLANASTLSMGNNNGGITVNGAVTGDGGVKIVKEGDGGNTIYFNSTSNTFTGGVEFNSARGINLLLNSFVDSGTPGAGNIRFSSSRADKEHWFTLKSGYSAPLVLNNRQFDVADTGADDSNESIGIRNNSAQELTINSDLIVSGTNIKRFKLGGSGAGTNTFVGSITNGSGVVHLIKVDSGTWILSGTNTYTSGTTISGGTLLADGANSLGNGNVTVSAGTLDLNATGAMGGGTLTVSGGTLVIGAVDAMPNTAALYLPSDASANLTLDADQTVAELYLNGSRQPNGSYTNSEAWINGLGTLTVGTASAGPIYWDIDGNSGAGAGGASPSGNWDAVTPNWHNEAGTGGTPAVWPAGRTAVFAAGTNATGDYTVSVVGTRDISGLTVEEGNVTLSGGTALRMTADSLISVAAGSTTTVATAIAEDATVKSLAKGGEGVLVLSVANSFTGPTTVNAGTLVLSDADAIAPEVVDLEAGNLVVGADVNISNLVFSGTSGTVSGDFTLDLGAGAVIDSDGRSASSSEAGGVVHEMSCGISGSPDVHLRQSWWRANDAKCKQNRFEPMGNATQALGVIRFDYYNDSGAGTRVVLAGSSTNNTVRTFFAPNHSYDDRVQKEGSGTWTITEDSAGQYYGIDIYVEGGTLIWNGSHSTGGAYSIQNGRFAGNHNYTTTYDARGTINVKTNGILSPGVGGAGTMTFGWVGTQRADGKLHMQDGSIYEYDVGATTNDLIHMSGNVGRTQTLDLDNFKLRVLDAGGDPQGDPLPVFTYDSNVVVDTNDFPNAAANFDLATAGIEPWGSGGLSLSNNVSEGVIYLVGLVKPPSGMVIIVR